MSTPIAVVALPSPNPGSPCSAAHTNCPVVMGCTCEEAAHCTAEEGCERDESVSSKLWLVACGETNARSKWVWEHHNMVRFRRLTTVNSSGFA